MKRKILILLCAACLVLSFSVTAFASNITLPQLPRENGEYIVYRVNGVYHLWFSDNFTLTDGEKVSGENLITYKLIENEWTLYTESGWKVSTSLLFYDSTGKFLTTNLIEFEKMVEFEDFNPFYDGLKGQITVQNVVGVLVVGATAVVGIVFIWWGARKGVKALMSAFRKGKISL